MVSSNNAINNKVGATISGVTNTLTVTNPSNTASSAARTTITVGGATAADPTLNFNVSGVTDWEMGIDNNASDFLKISQGTALGTNDTWIMTTSGERTMPLQPSFNAYLSADVNNVTGDGTSYTIIFDGENFDIGSNYDNTTGVFTAPVDGIYYFYTSVDMKNIASSNNDGKIAFFYNTTFQIPVLRQGVYSGGYGGATKNFNGNGAIIYQMTAGDTMEATLGVTGGSKVVGIEGTDGQPRSYFVGYLLG